MKRQVQIALIIPLFFVLEMAFAKSASMKVDCKMSPAGGFVAETANVKGTAVKNKDGSVSAKDIIVDMASIKTGRDLRDEHMRKRLQTDKFPVATLIKADGKDGRGTGEMDFKGQKKPIKGTYKIEDGFLVADFKMSLSEWKVEDVKYMGVGVKDEIAITITVPIKAAGAEVAAPAATKPTAKPAEKSETRKPQSIQKKKKKK